MSHFGIIAPPVAGHLNPLGVLGRELRQRGHRVTLLGIPDVAAKACDAGLDFVPIGAADHPLGSLAESLAQLRRLTGRAALRYVVAAIRRTTIAICRDGPDAIRATGIDTLLVDQTEPAGGTVAELLRLPFVTVCCALAMNREPDVPPPFTGWGYVPNWLARLRNRVGYAVADWLVRPVWSVVQDYRRQWGLPALRTPEDTFSPLAQVSQQPAAFDLPRQALPATFHYTGPWRDETASVAFPWDRLTGQPLIYATLGTQLGSNWTVFQSIAAACEGLHVQLVITHGHGLSDAQVQSLPGRPLVVSYAPQRELLARAALTVTHGGLNTVLDALSLGVPVVVAPITHEQPGVAARVRWTGTGEVVPLRRLSVGRLRSALRRVQESGAYQRAACRMRDAIAQSGGVGRAADVIERVALRQGPGTARLVGTAC